MALHPRVVAYARNLKRIGRDWHHVHTWMGAFGAPTAKPTRLFSDNLIVRRLHRKMPRSFQSTHKVTKVDQAKTNSWTGMLDGHQGTIASDTRIPM